MVNITASKLIAVVLVVLLIANMFLYPLGYISGWTFWLTLGVVLLYTQFSRGGFEEKGL